MSPGWDTLLEAQGERKLGAGVAVGMLLLSGLRGRKVEGGSYISKNDGGLETEPLDSTPSFFI